MHRGAEAKLSCKAVSPVTEYQQHKYTRPEIQDKQWFVSRLHDADDADFGCCVVVPRFVVFPKVSTTPCWLCRLWLLDALSFGLTAPVSN